MWWYCFTLNPIYLVATRRNEYCCWQARRTLNRSCKECPYTPKRPMTRSAFPKKTTKNLFWHEPVLKTGQKISAKNVFYFFSIVYFWLDSDLDVEALREERRRLLAICSWRLSLASCWWNTMNKQEISKNKVDSWLRLKWPLKKKW